MAVDLARVAKQKGIKYFLISFVDMFGVLRAKLVPARAIGAMQKEGAGFAVDTNVVTLIDAEGRAAALGKLSKLDVADRLLDRVRDLCRPPA